MRPRAAPLGDVEAALRSGGLACFPTETLWSLSCRADRPDAVRQVFAVKHRPPGAALAVGFPSWEAARSHVVTNPAAEALAHRFLPGPLSIVLRCSGTALAYVAPGLGTLSVRVPDHPVAQRLLAACGPLVMTSANRHGAPDPRTTEDVLRSLDDDATRGDLLVLADAEVLGRGSTVVDVTGGRPRVLREGIIPKEEVERAWP